VHESYRKFHPAFVENWWYTKTYDNGAQGQEHLFGRDTARVIALDSSLSLRHQQKAWGFQSPIGHFGHCP
jgi:hypothetical protein